MKYAALCTLRRADGLLAVHDRELATMLCGGPASASADKAELFVRIGPAANEMLDMLVGAFDLHGEARQSLSTALRVAAVRETVLQEEETYRDVLNAARAADALRHLTVALVDRAKERLRSLLVKRRPAESATAACQKPIDRARMEVDIDQLTSETATKTRRRRRKKTQVLDAPTSSTPQLPGRVAPVGRGPGTSGERSGRSSSRSPRLRRPAEASDKAAPQVDSDYEFEMSGLTGLAKPVGRVDIKASNDAKRAAQEQHLKHEMIVQSKRDPAHSPWGTGVRN